MGLHHIAFAHQQLELLGEKACQMFVITASTPRSPTLTDMVSSQHPTSSPFTAFADSDGTFTVLSPGAPLSTTQEKLYAPC